MKRLDFGKVAMAFLCGLAGALALLAGAALLE